ncbi:MAG TPA: type III polyketide synthase, partial [Actinotalea sp.]|nr:type III polyketide synthase [Actinotalea sp.]
MSHLVGLAPALPRHGYRQEEITAMLAELLQPSGHERALMHRVHASAGVRTRHLTLPLGEYGRLDSFDTANALFLSEGLELAADALGKALADAGLIPRDVDVLVFTSVTGVSAPSLDAALVDRLALRPDVRRMPSFGLGCAGGAAGLALAHALLAGRPHGVRERVDVGHGTR